MSDLVKRLLVFGALIAWCVALLALRVLRSGSYAYAFLVWNLFLAVIPAVAAMVFVKSKRTFARVFWFILWLLFLPNAPYIATDFVHLHPGAGAPLWYDIALLLSFAGTGLLLGYSSLADIQDAIAQRFGAHVGWWLALTTLILSGFGIYLGRFLRWNSWDALTNADEVARYILRGAADPLSHPRTIAVTLIYGVGLILGYLAYQLPRFRMNMQSP